LEKEKKRGEKGLRKEGHGLHAGRNQTPIRRNVIFRKGGESTQGLKILKRGSILSTDQLVSRQLVMGGYGYRRRSKECHRSMRDVGKNHITGRKRWRFGKKNTTFGEIRLMREMKGRGKSMYKNTMIQNAGGQHQRLKLV